jgi:hypothetical protein
MRVIRKIPTTPTPTSATKKILTAPTTTTPLQHGTRIQEKPRD